MKKAIKTIMKIIVIIIILTLFLVLIYSLYINKTNKLSPEDTIKKYINYWKDDFTIGMKSLESKEADFVDVIRNTNKRNKIENIRIQDVTENENKDIIERYNGKFAKEDIKIYLVKFNVKSSDSDWDGEHTFIVDLVHEKQGWLVLSFGNP